jgi:hypothetical protein
MTAQCRPGSAAPSNTNCATPPEHLKKPRGNPAPRARQELAYVGRQRVRLDCLRERASPADGFEQIDPLVNELLLLDTKVGTPAARLEANRDAAAQQIADAQRAAVEIQERKGCSSATATRVRRARSSVGAATNRRLGCQAVWWPHRAVGPTQTDLPGSRRREACRPRPSLAARQIRGPASSTTR